MMMPIDWVKIIIEKQIINNTSLARSATSLAHAKLLKQVLSGDSCALGGEPSTRPDQQAPGQLRFNTVKVAQEGA
ncbi:unnamed protein product [Lupinus luteus]|uniref:Uncharacterized protein n=1 Tax=Lupinus luteus TaxID=3873 RepID=A0AAV1VYH8_LUPLU